MKKKKRVRLSMKLLWQIAYAERGNDLPYDAAIATFLLKVDKLMKPLKP